MIALSLLALLAAVEPPDLLEQARSAFARADYDRAEAMANRLVQDSPKDANMMLVRAAVRGALHQYKDALADLDTAAKKIKDGRVEVARAVILQAVGRYDEALVLRKDAVKLRETLPSLSALASVHADRGEIREAERIYTQTEQAILANFGGAAFGDA